MTKDKGKPKRGRPPLKMPDPIPDTLDNVLRALLSNRTSEEKGGVDGTVKLTDSRICSAPWTLPSY